MASERMSKQEPMGMTARQYFSGTAWHSAFDNSSLAEAANAAAPVAAAAN